jgi:hypothetical protein
MMTFSDERYPRLFIIHLEPFSLSQEPRSNTPRKQRQNKRKGFAMSVATKEDYSCPDESNPIVGENAAGLSAVPGGWLSLARSFLQVPSFVEQTFNSACKSGS